MNMCANHPESPAVAYCRNCGTPLCPLCRMESLGAVYCADHVPVAARTAPPGTPVSSTGVDWNDPRDTDTREGFAQGAAPPLYPAPGPASPYQAPSSHPSPALATLLGFIPGVGAIYNGQYAKGFIHALIVGLLISILSSEPYAPIAVTVSILLAAWWFYMVIEANQTAHALRAGIRVDEISSILKLNGSRAGFPVGAVILIGLGFILLLDTTGFISMSQVIRYWPIGLVILGVYMLYSRLQPPPVAEIPARYGEEEFTPEFTNERR